MIKIVLEIPGKTAAGSHVGTYQAMQCRRCFPLTANSHFFPELASEVNLQVNLAQAFGFLHPRRLRDFSLSHLKKVTRGSPCLGFTVSAGRPENCARLSNWTYSWKISCWALYFSVILTKMEKML